MFFSKKRKDEKKNLPSYGRAYIEDFRNAFLSVYFYRLIAILNTVVSVIAIIMMHSVATSKENFFLIRENMETGQAMVSPIEWKAYVSTRAADVRGAGWLITKNLLNESSDSFGYQVYALDSYLSVDIAQDILDTWKKKVNIGGKVMTYYEYIRSIKGICSVEPVDGEVRVSRRKVETGVFQYRFEAIVKQICRYYEGNRIKEEKSRRIYVLILFYPVKRTETNPHGLVAEYLETRQVDPRTRIEDIALGSSYTLFSDTPETREFEGGQP